jgi:hypothetical protein
LNRPRCRIRSLPCVSCQSPELPGKPH